MMRMLFSSRDDHLLHKAVTKRKLLYMLFVHLATYSIIINLLILLCGGRPGGEMGQKGEFFSHFSSYQFCSRLFKSSSTTVWLEAQEAAHANVLHPPPLLRHRRLPHHRHRHRPPRHPCHLRLHLQMVRDKISLPTGRTQLLTR